LAKTIISASELDAKVGKELEINDDFEVAKIKRLRYVDGKPFVLQTAHLPRELCENILKEGLTGSLYQVLRKKYELVPVRAKNMYEARLAEPEEVELLELPKLSAVLVMFQTSYLEDNRPLEYTYSIYRGLQRFGSGHVPLVSRDSDPK
jgi:GntR family transcriptional regulator